MSDAALSSGWQAIHGLQHYLEHNKWLDASALAAEEALTDVLDAFLSGHAVTDAEINRRFHSRRKNRRRRNRQREKLVKTHAEKSIRLEIEVQVSDPSVEVENIDFLRTVELKMDPGNFILLKRIADGTTYTELAVELRMSEASLRTKVCRVRENARSIAA
jgi:ABC-type uncharacterized transport system fused permease/ATPase subunit